MAWITIGGRHEYHTWIDEAKLFAKLNLIIQNQTEIMSKEERLLAAIAQLDEATTDIAGDLQTLRDQLAAANVSEETLSTLDAKIATLKALGQDPAAPVPGGDPIG